MAAGPNIHPIAPVTAKRTSINLATANTNRDGSGTVTTLVTAGSNGAVVPSIRARTGVAAASSSTAMVCRLWHKVAGSGSWYLIDEVALPSVSPSTTAVGAGQTFNLTNIALEANGLLGVTQSVSESVYYTADQGDY